MKDNFIPAVRLTLVCLVFFCGLYTLAVWSMAQLAPGKGKGVTLTENGKTHHLLVGQAFTSDRYFWSRPSAVDYNAAGSGGSNKGPSNEAYLSTVQERVHHFLKHHPGIHPSEVPSDLVTASGSGLDPHISVQAAKVQIKRIAVVRNLSESMVEQLILEHTEKPLFGLLGTERIHVLKLNLGLDNLK